jgi:hypothetical protein
LNTFSGTQDNDNLKQFISFAEENKDIFSTYIPTSMLFYFFLLKEPIMLNRDHNIVVAYSALSNKVLWLDVSESRDGSTPFHRIMNPDEVITSLSDDEKSAALKIINLWA